MLVTAFGFGLWKSARRNRAVRIVGGLYPGLRIARAPVAICGDASTRGAGRRRRHAERHHARRSGRRNGLPHVSRDRSWRHGIREALPARVPDRHDRGAPRVRGVDVLEAPRLQANLPTPWIGLWERIDVSVFLLWIAVPATAMLRTRTGRRHASRTGPSMTSRSRESRSVRYRLRRPDVRPVSIVARWQPSTRVRRPRIRASFFATKNVAYAHPHRPGHLREHAGFRGRTSSSDSSGAGSVGMDRHSALRCRVGVGSGDRGRGRLRAAPFSAR